MLNGPERGWRKPEIPEMYAASKSVIIGERNKVHKCFVKLSASTCEIYGRLYVTWQDFWQDVFEGFHEIQVAA